MIHNELARRYVYVHCGRVESDAQFQHRKRDSLGEKTHRDEAFFVYDSLKSFPNVTGCRHVRYVNLNE
jgi:hypothetical protein